VNDFSQDMETRLLVLLGKELEIFEQIRELTKKQAELLAADDDKSDAFGSSLDRRQELIEKNQRIASGNRRPDAILCGIFECRRRQAQRDRKAERAST
jgi:hypothetical protein